MPKKEIKGKFKPSLTAEKQFQRALMKVARTAGHIIESHVTGVHLSTPNRMQKALEDYADLITPWARSQSARLLQQVQKSNHRAYKNKSKMLGLEVNKQLSDTTYIGSLARALMDEQVALIKSIPLEAGQRAQKIAFEAAMHGTRAEPDQDTINELQKQLGLSTEVATSRAKLIAITETARANASINQARAQSVGSNQYRWHNSGDAAVRDSHRKIGGKDIGKITFSWDNPPTLDDGTKGHPGTFPRCRCFAEPIFDTE